tara:strand:+ start:37 stop:363 length:327 start_codon:yes stop_codon:yes gene_type:complete
MSPRLSGLRKNRLLLPLQRQVVLHLAKRRRLDQSLPSPVRFPLRLKRKLVRRLTSVAPMLLPEGTFEGSFVRRKVLVWALRSNVTVRAWVLSIRDRELLARYRARRTL